MFGSAKNITAQQPQVIGSLRVQSSCNGAPMPLLWGTTRVAPNLIWYGDFQAVPVYTGNQGGGGKGGGQSGGGKGGSGGTGPSSYQYYASLLMSLCMGPIDGVNTIWVGKQQTNAAQLGFSVFTGSTTQSPWSYLTSNHPGQDLAYRSEAYLAVASYRLTDVAEVPQHSVEVQGLKRYGLVAAAAASYTATAGNPTFSATAHGFTAGEVVQLSGGVPSPFGTGTDYYVLLVDANNFQLLANPWDWQAGGAGPIYPTSTASGTATPHVIDANPSDIVSDAMSNAIYGAGFTSGQIGDLVTPGNSFSKWCVANGIFLSPLLDSQQQARKLVDEIMQVTNCDMAWIDAGAGTGQLNVIPRGDVAVTGNGVTYTPSLSPVYSLSDDDFVPPAANEPPIKSNRTSPSDAYNEVQVEFFDRANQYNVGIAEAKDQTSIDLYVVRPMSTVSAHSLTSQSVAQVAANMILARALYVRTQYVFGASAAKFVLVEPGDYLNISDTGLGLVNQLVRVLKVEYSPLEDGLATFTTEEVPGNTGSTPQYGSQAGVGAQINFNVDPGPSASPVIFDAPGFLTTSGFEIWGAISGGPNWGGAEVWASTDNATFQRVDKVSNKGRYGFTTASFPSASDPDMTSTLSVDLSISQGTLLSGSKNDADLFNTSCMVGNDGEIVSYQTATLVSGFKYNLGTYLRRGIYQTTIANPAKAGVPFVRIDDAIFRYAYDPALVGKTIYFKFLPFNTRGGHLYQLSQVTSIPFLIGGPIGAPQAVTGFSVSQNGNVAVFLWNLLPQNNISGYEIRYNPTFNPDGSPNQQATNWGNASLLTQVTKGTQITTAKLPPGSWTCLIKAVDTSQRYSVTATAATIVMMNVNTIISQQSANPDWRGPASGFMRTPQGYLIPLSTDPAQIQLSLPAVAANYASTPSTAGLQAPASTNVDLRAWINPTSWTPAAAQRLVSKWNQTGNQRAYSLLLTSAGKLQMAWSTDGTAANTLTATSTAVVPTNPMIGVRAVLNPTTGTVTFYTANVGDYGAVWTVLGAPVTGSATSVFATSTAPVEVGSGTIGTLDLFAGTISRAMVVFGAEKWAADFFPDRDGARAGASVVSASTKETWTVNSTSISTPAKLIGCGEANTFAKFVPFPVKAVGAPGYYPLYTSPEVDLGFGGVPVRITESEGSILGAGVTTGVASPVGLLESSNVSGSYPNGFSPWVIGNITTRYFTSGITLDPSVGDAVILSFTPTADSPSGVETMANVAIAGGGTTVTFPQQFHNTPVVTATPVASTGFYATITNVTKTTCVIHVFNSSGTDVGGTVNIIAQGA